MAMFASKADETEETNKLWSTFRDTLSRIIFGTYKATSLPTSIQTEIRQLSCPRWKSFFVQRILVYHSHLISKKSTKLDLLLRTFDLEHKIKTLSASHLRRSNSLAQDAAQEPAQALPPPPPPPPLQAAIPAGGEIVPASEQSAD